MVNSKAENNMMIMMNSLKNDEGDADEEEEYDDNDKSN